MNVQNRFSTMRRLLSIALTVPAVLCAACRAPPTANIATPSPSVAVGAVVPLTADQSSDPNGEALTDAWRFNTVPAGSHASMFAADQIHAWFLPDVAGQYVVELSVADKDVSSAPATTSIDAGPCGSNAPVATAITASPASPGVGGPIGLSATVSDADNQAPCGLNQQLTYAWSLISEPAGSTVQLNGRALQSPSFSPQVAGTYVVGLSVTDSAGMTSALATQSIVVASAPACGANPPVAKLATTAKAGNCNIGGGGGCTVTPTVTVPANSPPNYAVTAIPTMTTWQSFDLQLDASPSFDPDNQAPCNLSQALSYKWEMLSAPFGGSWSWQTGGGGGTGVTVSSLINPTLQLRQPGTYQLRLTVTDGNQASAPVLIQIQTN